MASIRQRERKDGSAYWAVLYVLNGKQTSSSFNDPQEAVDFQTLANKTSPAKALEVWAAARPVLQGVGAGDLVDEDRQALLGVPGDLAPRVRESVKPVSITQRWLRADTVRVTFESAIGD